MKSGMTGNFFVVFPPQGSGYVSQHQGRTGEKVARELLSDRPTRYTARCPLNASHVSTSQWLTWKYTHALNIILLSIWISRSLLKDTLTSGHEEVGIEPPTLYIKLDWDALEQGLSPPSQPGVRVYN